MTPPRRYAQDTKVPVARSRLEIETTLERYGADQFIYGSERGRAIVGFRMQGRQVKIVLPLPDGQTVGSYMRPQIERSYTDGKMPPLLPAPGGN